MAVPASSPRVDDPLLGPHHRPQTLGVGQDGSWSFAVLNGQVSEGRIATLTVTAADAQGQPDRRQRAVAGGRGRLRAHHLINRITFGATPALLAEVSASAPDAFVAQQLDPAAIDDSAFAAMLAAQPRRPPRPSCRRQAFLRAVHSRRQLLEVLTAFWDNHFNTDVNKHQAVAYEVAENAAFRASALGPLPRPARGQRQEPGDAASTSTTP